MTEAKARLLVYSRSDGVCELCSTSRGHEWQHRKNRSQGGLWTPENGLHACRSCHRWIHGNVTEAQEKGWSVKQAFDPAAVSVVLARFSHRMYLTPDGAYAEVLQCA